MIHDLPAGERQERALTADERRILVHKPSILKSMHGLDGVDRIEKRRIEKQREKEEERKKRFVNKVTTRKDVMGIIDLYNQHKIIPLAARLDETDKVVAYMALPLWRRLWLRLKRFGDGVLAWLERRGINLYTVDTSAEDISPIERRSERGGSTKRSGLRTSTYGLARDHDCPPWRLKGNAMPVRADFSAPMGARPPGSGAGRAPGPRRPLRPPRRAPS